MNYFCFLNLLFLISFDLSICHSNFDYSFPKVRARQGGRFPYFFVNPLDENEEKKAGHYVSIVNEDLARRRGIRHEEICCSGSLYRHRYIITSASCLKPNNRYRVYILRDPKDGQRADWLLDFADERFNLAKNNPRIIAKYRHPGFEKKTFKNDIAIIVLSHPVPSYSAVNVELPDRYASGPKIPTDEDRDVEMAGFEDTDSEHNVPYIVEMKTLTSLDCDAKLNYGGKRRYFERQMICAEARGSSQIKNVNKQEDLGAGLVEVDTKCRRILLGIASNYKGNEKFNREHLPAVFTRVSYYRHWIDRVVAKVERGEDDDED